MVFSIFSIFAPDRLVGQGPEAVRGLASDLKMLKMLKVLKMLKIIDSNSKPHPIP